MPHKHHTKIYHLDLLFKANVTNWLQRKMLMAIPFEILRGAKWKKLPTTPT